MSIPKSQTQTDLYTNGEEFNYVSTGQPYVGYYWKLSNGTFYTGKNPQDLPSNQLVRATSNFENLPNSPEPISEIALPYDSPYVGKDESMYNQILILDYLKLKNISSVSPPITKIPTNIPTLPTDQDYKIGKFERYFCKKANEIIYLEINKDTYIKLVNKDSQILYQLYVPFKVTWQLTGDKTQVYNLNKKTVETTISKIEFPMFQEYLKNDFTKYYR